MKVLCSSTQQCLETVVMWSNFRLIKDRESVRFKMLHLKTLHIYTQSGEEVTPALQKQSSTMQEAARTHLYNKKTKERKGNGKKMKFFTFCCQPPSGTDSARYIRIIWCKKNHNRGLYGNQINNYYQHN